MIDPQPHGPLKAALLLAVGAAFAIVGLLLCAGGPAAQEAVFPDASPALAGLITWGPRTLLLLGGTMALGSTLVLSMGWMQKRD